MVKRWCGVLLAFAMIAWDTAPTMADDDGLSDFVDTYQCSLSGLIAKILDHDNRVEQDRFIILSLPGPKAEYVQCAFDNRDREGVCEASSGFWNNPWEQPHLTPVQLRALHSLGFSTDGSHENYQQHMHFSADGPEPDELARLMLKALFLGYGARKDMPIEIEAPFAPRHGVLPRQRCMAIS